MSLYYCTYALPHKALWGVSLQMAWVKGERVSNIWGNKNVDVCNFNIFHQTSMQFKKQ